MKCVATLSWSDLFIYACTRVKRVFINWLSLLITCENNFSFKWTFSESMFSWEELHHLYSSSLSRDNAKTKERIPQSACSKDKRWRTLFNNVKCKIILTYWCHVTSPMKVCPFSRNLRRNEKSNTVIKLDLINPEQSSLNLLLKSWRGSVFFRAPFPGLSRSRF